MANPAANEDRLPRNVPLEGGPTLGQGQGPLDQLFEQMSDIVAEKRDQVLAIRGAVGIRVLRYPLPQIWLRVGAGTNPVWIQREAHRILGMSVMIEEERGSPG